MREDEFEEPSSNKEKIMTILAIILCAAVLIGAAIFLFRVFGGKENAPVNQDTSENAEDPEIEDDSLAENVPEPDTGEDIQGAGDNETSDSNGADSESSADNQGTGESTGNSAEAGMKFQEVNETVTAKDVTNLRNIPSQGADSTVLRQLNNGETATRTGISDSGWSRLVLDGTTYYAVSNYLTTDLAYQPPEPETEEDDGIKTQFTACQEQVTPKIEINLRNIPSVTIPDAVVVATAYAGEVFIRTGINTDVGWSRVEYNGQVLYCVSSYLDVVE